MSGTVFVPLRFVADALGATTTYDSRGQRVEIVSPLIGRNVGDQTSPTARAIRGVISADRPDFQPPIVTLTSEARRAPFR